MFWNQGRWTIWFIMSSWALKFSDDDYLDTLCFGVFHIKKNMYIFAFLVYLHLSVQFSRSFMYESLWPHGLQHARLLCPSPTPGACSDSCPLSRWCHPTISSSVVPSPPTFNLSQHQGLPLSQFFTSGGQSIGVSPSASVLPINIQDWFPLGWTGSPCCPRDSQESFPTPQLKSINSSALSFLYSPALTSIHDYWKNHGFD